MAVQKVTDSRKIVTDPLVLKRLAEQGIDVDLASLRLNDVLVGLRFSFSSA